MHSWWLSNRLFVDQTLIDVIFVLSFYVAYQAGVFSLGSIGFMAVGAYMTAVVTTHYGLSVAMGIILGMFGGAVLAAVMGLILARLEGIYFALGSFAFAQATIVVIGELGITHGQQGIAAIPGIQATWWALLAIAICCGAFQLIGRSHVGRAFAAVRLDREMARGLGIPAARYRLAAFVASGVLAALAGGLQAHELTVVTPGEYSFSVLVLGLTYTMVGGVDSWIGPVLAAVVLDIFREWARHSGTDWETMAYGVMLLVVIFLAPRGLTDPVVRARIKRFFLRAARQRRFAEPAQGQPAVARGRPAAVADHRGSDVTVAVPGATGTRPVGSES